MNSPQAFLGAAAQVLSGWGEGDIKRRWSINSPALLFCPADTHNAREECAQAGRLVNIHFAVGSKDGLGCLWPKDWASGRVRRGCWRRAYTTQSMHTDLGVNHVAFCGRHRQLSQQVPTVAQSAQHGARALLPSQGGERMRSALAKRARRYAKREQMGLHITRTS
jgi:hypothetical protein